MNNDHLEKVAHGMKSLQLDDEDTSKYFINYVNNDHDEISNNVSDGEHSRPAEEENQIDVSNLPSSLIITAIPQELFVDQKLKDEFEELFRVYDPEIVVLYLKFFQRVRITFTTSFAALQARLHLHEYPFAGSSIKVYFASPIIFRGSNPEGFLQPPKPDKLFLISPPSSPPVGWEQTFEDPPVVDLNLIAAIAQLKPNEIHELVPSDLDLKTPSIVIHTCDDVEQVEENSKVKLIKPNLVQTRRPPTSS